MDLHLSELPILKHLDKGKSALLCLSIVAHSNYNVNYNSLYYSIKNGQSFPSKGSLVFIGCICEYNRMFVECGQIKLKDQYLIKQILMSYYYPYDPSCSYVIDVQTENAIRHSRIEAEVAASRIATELALRRSRIETEVAIESALRRSRVEAELAASRIAAEDAVRRSRIEADIAVENYLRSFIVREVKILFYCFSILCNC